MNGDSLFDRAAPDCRDCGHRVARVEHAWHVDEDGVWRLRGFLVCVNRHRLLVEPLPS